MLSEYDVVRLRSSTSVDNVPAGSRGIVLIVYNDTPLAYEVEFVDGLGSSLGTITLQESDLEFEPRT